MMTKTQKEWRINNPDKLKKQRERYYLKNKDRILKEQKTRLPKIREDRRLNPSKYKNYDLKKSFGISLEQFLQMLEDQKGLCKVCGTDDPGYGRSFCVDHCHKTNKIRGLLCNNCNRALGLLKDSKEILIKAVEYLSVGDN